MFVYRVVAHFFLDSFGQNGIIMDLIRQPCAIRGLLRFVRSLCHDVLFTVAIEKAALLCCWVAQFQRAGTKAFSLFSFNQTL
jgi:hypothetical protein